jgi:hypothetical protein
MFCEKSNQTFVVEELLVEPLTWIHATRIQSFVGNKKGKRE